MSIAAPSPDDLWQRYRARRDVAALGSLFDEVAPALFRIALSLLPDPHVAEDAVQETFLAAIERGGRHDADRPVVPWLVGILRIEVLRARRSAARRPDARRMEEGRRATADADGLPDTAQVRAAIESLPEPYRAASLLRWRYGLTPAEVAHVRGEPPGTTRSLLSRALARLRAALGAGAGARALAPGSPEGLAAVRRAVIARAAGGPSGPGAKRIGGVLVGAKASIVLAVVLLLATGAVALVVADPFHWRGGPGSGASPETAVAPADHPPPSVAPPAPVLSGSAPPARAQRDDVPAAGEAPQTPKAEVHRLRDIRATAMVFLEDLEKARVDAREEAPATVVALEITQSWGKGTLEAARPGHLEVIADVLKEDPRLGSRAFEKRQGFEMGRMKTTANGSWRVEFTWWTRHALDEQPWEPGGVLTPGALTAALPKDVGRFRSCTNERVEGTESYRGCEIELKDPSKVWVAADALGGMPGCRITEIKWADHDPAKPFLLLTLQVAARRAE